MDISRALEIVVLLPILLSRPFQHQSRINMKINIVSDEKHTKKLLLKSINENQ